MSFIGTFVRHPRRLFLRRALFQVHLWCGVLISIYVVVIALTGSVLVFRSELTRSRLPAQLTPYDPAHIAPISTVLTRFHAAYPQAHIADLTLPSEPSPAYLLQAADGQKHTFFLVADPAHATFYPHTRSWVDWVYDLHTNLLLGNACGMQVNGIGAAILLVLCATGAAIWWSGIRTWVRGIRIDFRRNWRRVNFDMHHAIGIWTLSLVFWWAFSGMYFAWYRQVTAAVAMVSPLQGMVSPRSPAQACSGTQRVGLDTLLEAIHRASPDGHLFSLSDPALSGKTMYALVDRKAPGDFSHRDIVTLCTQDARVLTIWHYGQNHTAGDWVIWAMHPIHFGTLWGTPVKIVWAGLGVSLAMLSVTGLLMYWNRYLRHRLRRAG